MESTPSPAERRKTSTALRGRKRKRNAPTSKGGPASDSEEEDTKGDNSGIMAPPPVPPAKKIQQSPGVATTPSKAHGDHVSASGRASIKVDSSPLKPSSRSGSMAPSLKESEGQDDRDDVSVTESSKGHRRTEEERIQFFQSQSDCREVEPHRAFCTRCDQWVPLNPVRAYVMRPWLVHRGECRRNTLSTKQLTPNARNKEDGAPDGSKGDDDDTSVVQSASSTPGRLVRGEAERQAYLEGDPRSEEVRPYEVLCKTCKKWVQTGNKTRYSLNHWKDHQKRCSGSIPSSRVATAERKLKLVNDASAKSFTATSVLCSHCDKTIVLDGEGSYNLTKWQEHKVNCPSSPLPEHGTSTKAPNASPSRSERSENCPPLSVASTEATAVEAAALLGSGKKRQREADEDETERRPRKRQAATPSGALDWLLLPFRSFVNGFKKGISSEPESTAT